MSLKTDTSGLRDFKGIRFADDPADPINVLFNISEIGLFCLSGLKFPGVIHSYSLSTFKPTDLSFNWLGMFRRDP